MPKVLLLSPGFHGYAESINRSFATIGVESQVVCYDRMPGLAPKVKNKLARELPEKLRLREQPRFDSQASDIAATAIRESRPDIVLVIKGDRFDDRVHEAMDEVGARRILWLYDEVCRTRHDAASLDRYEAVISYSPQDTKAFAEQGRVALYVPNGFDETMQPRPRHDNRIVFIGARYPRREELLLALAKSGVPHLAIGRDWSSHPVDRLRTWQWRRPRVQAAREIDRLDGYALTAGAPAALNVHGDQDGFTMKTFEVPGVGGVQLIDRDDVVEFYDPGSEVLVFHDEDELVDLAWRTIRDDRWGDKIREAGRRRTLAEHTFAHRARKVSMLWA